MSLCPRVLVLDEPTANLDPESTVDLGRKIREFKEEGMAVEIPDHRLYWLEGVAEWVAVMDRGEIVESGPFSILSHKDLRESHGLRAACVEDPRPGLGKVSANGIGIRVEDLRFAYRGGPELFGGASFSLPREVTGLLGKNGAGKTTLARLLTGLSRMRSGKVYLDGESISPSRLLKRASIVLQNADHQLQMKTVGDEAMLCANGACSKQRAEKVAEILERFGLSGLIDRHPQSLSGGEKQRLAIACGMIKEPDILILDEPTSGLDGRNMRMIAESIRQAAERGASVLLISHDLELLDSACDRALHLPLGPCS